MSIPRHALLPQITPHHNRLPAAGSGLWYPLHGSLVGLPDTPAALEIVTSGSAHASKWSADPLMYQLPTNNGTTNVVGLRVPHDESIVDDVLTLISAPVGTQILVALTVAWADLSTAGWLWGYGVNNANSIYGLSLLASELPQFVHRGANATAQTNLAVGSGLTLTSGTALSDAQYRAARMHSVTSLRVTGAMAADLELRFATAAVSCVYTGACDFSLNAATTAPGLGLIAPNLHGGLSIGARNASGGANVDSVFGAGAAVTARVGNLCARRFAAYSAARAADGIAALLARPDDYPAPWLADAP